MERAERIKQSKKLPHGINITPDGRYRVRVFYDGKQHECGIFQDYEVALAVNRQSRIDVALGVFVPPAEKRRQRKRELEEEAARAALIDPNQEQLPGV